MAEQDPRVGATLGRYRIERVIGRGAFGTVYLAVDTNPHLPRRVALKVMSPELAADPDIRERFRRESVLAVELDHHSSIVPVYDAGEHERALYIAMRYIEGTDLELLLTEHGPVELDHALSIMGQVAAALDVAHAAGLVHRDVKPANILLSDDNRHAYLADFGLTKRFAAPSAATQAGHFLGTFFYAAPEQIEGKDVDGRTDQYALGCVLHQMLTGNPPFVGETTVIVAAHLTRDPPAVAASRADAPPELDAVVRRAMAKSPSERFETCGAMAAAAREAVRRPATAPATTPVPEAPGRRPPAWVLVSAVAAAVVVVGAVALFATQGGGGGGNGGPEEPPPPSAQAVAAADLEEGDCWNGNPPSDETVEVVACTEPHDSETYAVVAHPDEGDEFPGDGDLDEFSANECTDAFEPYIGVPPDDSELQPARLWPDRNDWEDGVARVYCYVSGPDGEELEGSIEGSNR